MDAVYQALIECIQQNKPAAIATVVKVMGSSPREAGAKMLVYPDGSIIGSVGGGEMELRVIRAARDAIRDGKPRYLDMTLSDDVRGDPMICGGEMEIFVEPLQRPPTMLIIGAGHIGVACAQLAKSLGFRVMVWDDRAELATQEHVPSADELETGNIVEKLQSLDVLPQTYIVLVTRLHTLDAELLRAAIDKPASYIGMLGSERRVLTVFKMLREQGVREEDLGRVHAPIGVKIGAETPAEIAVSIMAEVIQAKSKDEGRG